MDVTEAATMDGAIVREDRTDVLSSWFDGCDTVVVGADMSLSIAAGMAHAGERFDENFGDFLDILGADRMILPRRERFESDGQYWAYWSRVIMLNRYAFEENGTYAALRELLRGKNYFVLTATTDHCFHRFGFNKSRIFCPQGDYGELQCPEGCDGTIIQARDVVTRMYASQRGPKVPEDLIPTCPECGRCLVPHIRLDEKFVQDDCWYDAAKRFDNFMEASAFRDTLYLSLGVGIRMYDHITRRFLNATARNTRSYMASIGDFECEYPAYLFGRAMHIREDIRGVLRSLAGRDPASL